MHLWWGPYVAFFDCRNPGLVSKASLAYYYSNVRPTPFTFRATRKTEREKHCVHWWRQREKSCVLCGGAAVVTLCKYSKLPVFQISLGTNKNAMYLSRPPGALKSLIRLNVGLRTGYDLGYIAFLSETAQVLPIALTAINLS